MKTRITKKAVLENGNCLCVGYCQMQYLLKYKTPAHYTAGVYGWNADVYNVKGYSIVTGYRPFGKEIDGALLDKYEKRAKELYLSDKPDDYKEFFIYIWLRSLLNKI